MEPLLYVCIFISMLVMAAFLAIIDQAIHKYIPGKYSKEDPTTFATASWYIISALLQQGKNKLLRQLYILLELFSI